MLTLWILLMSHLGGNLLPCLGKQTLTLANSELLQGSQCHILILRMHLKIGISPVETSKFIKLKALWFCFVWLYFSSRSLLQETLHIWSLTQFSSLELGSSALLSFNKISNFKGILSWDERSPIKVSAKIR